jgi:transposase
MADNSITKVAEVNQQYIQDTLTFLTYLIQKGEMEEVEEKFQETLRKAKRGGK